MCIDSNFRNPVFNGRYLATATNFPDSFGSKNPPGNFAITLGRCHPTSYMMHLFVLDLMGCGIRDLGVDERKTR